MIKNDFFEKIKKDNIFNCTNIEYLFKLQYLQHKYNSFQFGMKKKRVFFNTICSLQLELEKRKLWDKSISKNEHSTLKASNKQKERYFFFRKGKVSKKNIE
ncbi:hypothetical protein RFI_05177 [Reticulomyxa filosa]|uniref:Uncharacterized protein n=1 Tax=Reticulomyxa filosa TaxID=46433 RepID=X6P056_RETFI|nr:hypothetical protein RFI_05177 [Reticulomyxa filosa]|eukprot:ETO31940.1 hypothetical protein RFI_05177 [Reticulomyxa filosa]